MANIIKQTFCKHENLRKMNVEIGKDVILDDKHKKYNSVWICEKCGKIIYRED